MLSLVSFPIFSSPLLKSTTLRPESSSIITLVRVDIFFSYDFLDATSSNWNIADSGTARKSDVIMHGNGHPVQTKPGLQTLAVHRSVDASSKIL